VDTTINYDNISSLGKRLIFVKLGGSLITDKTRAYTLRRENLERLAVETRQALNEMPETQLILGHGSGSFGHWAAKPYGTRDGVCTPSQWRGFAKVSAAANRLNRIFTDVFLDADVPVLSIQPSATARCHDGVLEYLDTTALTSALANGLVPVVYGDVAWDNVRGGTIISTEEIFCYLAKRLYPSHILLLGEAPGVVDLDHHVIDRITPEILAPIQSALGGSRGADVTGGMEAKVLIMVELVQQIPGTVVHILAGTQPDLLRHAITNPTFSAGTTIESATSR
jgi:isopentenyl phosphate kinase